MMIYPFSYLFMPFIPPNCDKPPTVYSILNSIVNGDKEEEDYTKIKDLAKEGRTTIFNFEYPLSNNINKEQFETQILNHYLMRRIGFETVTAFRIQLNVKLNEIMPMYNKMFDSLENWNIFEDGETTTREGTENRKNITENSNINTTTNNTNNTSENTNTSSNTLKNTSNTTSNDITDDRNSDTPQSKLENVRDGSYVTNYKYNTIDRTSDDTSTSNGTSDSKTNINETNITNSNSNTQNNTNTTDDNVYNETIKRSPADKISILKEMQENIKSIYTLIYQDLECLFYGLE